MTPLNRTLAAAAVCLGLAIVTVVPALPQADPQVGVWKLDAAKSKYSPGPIPTSGTTTIEAVGKGTKVSVEQTLADGSKRQCSFTAAYDGKDTPVAGNNPDADTVARTRINASTVKTVSKKAGKVTTTQTSAVSGDGHTTTGTITGDTAQ